MATPGVYSGAPNGNAYISQFDTVTLQETAVFNLPAIANADVTDALGGAVSPDGTRFYAPYIYGPFQIGGLTRPAPLGSVSASDSADPQSGLAVFDTATGELLNIFPQVSFDTTERHKSINLLMSVVNKKSRMVSFRLSVAERKAAKKTCFQHGIRGVSTLARHSRFHQFGQFPD